MVIKAKLNSADIKRMADEVEGYRYDFQVKVHTILRRLADKGIAAAALSVGNMGQYITFTKQNDPYGVTIVAQETSVIVAEWMRYGQLVHAEVSPLLMSEFGAGKHAIIWEGQNGNTNTLPDGKQIGRGTFPNQTHAFEDSWYYMDVNGNWHVATGIKPTRPLHNAVMEIITQVEATAREVFGYGSN